MLCYTIGSPERRAAGRSGIRRGRVGGRCAAQLVGVHPGMSEVHKSGRRTTGHSVESIGTPYKQSLCPVVICPYLCSCDWDAADSELRGTGRSRPRLRSRWYGCACFKQCVRTCSLCVELTRPRWLHQVPQLRECRLRCRLPDGSGADVIHASPESDP